MVKGYRVSSDREQMDVAVIHGFLSHSYWARGIPPEVVQRSLENSLCFGVFTDSDSGSGPGEQVGFARLITDYATFAYLGDVFILGPHRGLGLSQWLMDEIMAHPQLQGLRRMLLATADAHGVYQRFGFTPLPQPERFMTLHRPEVYQHD